MTRHAARGPCLDQGLPRGTPEDVAMPDDTATAERLRAIGVELDRQNSELGRAYRALSELGAVSLRVSEADLRAIAEATAPVLPASTVTPGPWHGARC